MDIGRMAARAKGRWGAGRRRLEAMMCRFLFDMRYAIWPPLTLKITCHVRVLFTHTEGVSGSIRALVKTLELALEPLLPLPTY